MSNSPLTKHYIQQIRNTAGAMGLVAIACAASVGCRGTIDNVCAGSDDEAPTLTIGQLDYGDATYRYVANGETLYGLDTPDDSFTVPLMLGVTGLNSLEPITTYLTSEFDGGDSGQDWWASSNVPLEWTCNVDGLAVLAFDAKFAGKDSGFVPDGQVVTLSIRLEDVDGRIVEIEQDAVLQTEPDASSQTN